jgi:hypothetical protein
MNSAPALRLRLSSENLLLLLAAAVGLATGLLVVGFRYLIGWWRYLLQDTLVDGLGRAAEHYGLWLLGSWTLALAPVLGGLLIGALRAVVPFPNLSLSGLVSLLVLWHFSPGGSRSSSWRLPSRWARELPLALRPPVWKVALCWDPCWGKTYASRGSGCNC